MWKFSNQDNHRYDLNQIVFYIIYCLYCVHSNVLKEIEKFHSCTHDDTKVSAGLQRNVSTVSPPVRIPVQASYGVYVCVC